MGERAASRVLVVDDDRMVARAAKRMLEDRGFEVTISDDGEEAVGLLRELSFDAILSDISMPGMDGIEFLRAVRQRDLDIPVLLMTGDPSLATAMHAIEYGAFGYVVKPPDPADLARRLQRAAALHGLARLKRQALELAGLAHMGLGDLASAEARFASALRGLWMAYQPIVDWRARRVVSYEALVRTDESTLARPDDLFGTAIRLGRLHELGRTIRARVAEQVPSVPEGVRVFVNVHPDDLGDEELLGDGCPLHAHATRVVLEVTERARLDALPDAAGTVSALRARGYQIALDDLGAGYAGLQSFMQLEPDVVKLDMSLVRGVDGDSAKRRIVRAMIRLCRQLGVPVIGEGVETAGERDTVVALGCDWLQGYLFARPGRALPDPSWD